MEGLDQIEQKIMEKLRKQLRERVEKYAGHLYKKAVDSRLSAKGAHDFTGNLLASIIVIVCEDATPYKQYDLNHPFGRRLRRPSHPKMSAPGKYHFEEDYENRESNFKAEVKTDKGFGLQDAQKFFDSFRGDSQYMFEVFLAYPVEYAEYVDNYTGTVGFVETKDWGENSGLKILKIGSFNQ